MTLALRSLTAATALSLLLLAGCRISTDKDGKNDKVDIGTPFGSMHVKTNDNVDANAIGIAVYPGATPYKDDSNNDNSADINLSFGSFHLGVKAATYLTQDSTDKVFAFYRKDLARYGDVIECRGSTSVGEPNHTSQGLTCDEKNGNHVNTHTSTDTDLELRAGSQQHQHVVGVKTKEGGTKIALVALDLPSHLSDHDSKDVE